MSRRIPNRVAAPLGGVEADFLHYPLHDGYEATCPDVVHRLVYLVGGLGHLDYRIVGEVDHYALGGKQGHLLLGERIFRLGENSDEVVPGKIIQLNADGQSTLEFRYEVGRLAAMECAGGDEQNVVGLDRAVACLDSAAFDDRKQIALYALAGDIRPVRLTGSGELVELIKEDDPAVFGTAKCHLGDLLTVDQFLALLVEDELAGFAQCETSPLGLGWN